MTSRRDRDSVYEERDTYYSGPPRRGPPSREEVDFYERREVQRERRSPPRGRIVEEEIETRVRERSRERVPAFLREENIRRTEAGPLVLRSRETETIERPRPRPRPRSPSPGVVIHEREVLRRRSPSPRSLPPPSPGPSMERLRTRIIERERSPSPPPVRMERVSARLVERMRSPSPVRERERIRIVDRERQRSPSPVRSRSRVRIVERERERPPPPSPSPSPPPSEPPVIRGPTIEREVITHYRDIDHGKLVCSVFTNEQKTAARLTQVRQA